MKLYYICLIMGLFLIVSIGFIGPYGMSAASTELVVVTFMYLCLFCPWVLWRGFKLLLKEIRASKEEGMSDEK